MNYRDKSSLNIRSAKIDDAKAISNMVIQNVIHFHTDNYSEEELLIWQRGYTAIEIENQIKTREVFVLEKETNIRGIIQFEAPEIKGFYIDPNYKKIGNGAILLQFMLSKLQQHGYFEVELTCNQLAIGFYEKFDFELIGQEIIYWENHPFIEYRMRKKLSRVNN